MSTYLTRLKEVTDRAKELGIEWKRDPRANDGSKFAWIVTDTATDEEIFVGPEDEAWAFIRGIVYMSNREFGEFAEDEADDIHSPARHPPTVV